MITLTYGLKIPQTSDSSSAIFDAIEDDITQVDGHTHNGSDSASLPAQSIVGVTQSILSASWSASGATGHYRQQVTVPAGFDFDTVQISFRTAAGAIILPTIERVSDTQYYVYTTDNSLTYTAVYGG